MPYTFAPHAPYNSFAAAYKPPTVHVDMDHAASGMTRTAPVGASYNTNSLSHFAATASATVWPPPAHAANQLRSHITDLLRRNAHNEDGVSLQAIDQVLRGFSIIDITHEITKMADEGQTSSQRESPHPSQTCNRRIAVCTPVILCSLMRWLCCTFPFLPVVGSQV